MFIHLLFAIFSTVHAIQYNCQGTGLFHEEGSYYRAELVCEDSRPVEVKKFFKKNNSIMSLERFNESGQLIEKKSYNLEGEMTIWKGMEWLSDNQFIEIRYHSGRSDKLETARSLFEILADETKVLKKRWNFKKTNELPTLNYKVESVDLFNDRGQIISRKILFSPYGLENYTFNYEQPLIKNKFDFIDQFTIEDEFGNRIGDFAVKNENPLDTIYDSMAGDIEKINIFEDQSRREIGIIDTGFSFSHPAINYKLGQNTLDPVDGIDNDENGIIDDTFGFYVDDDGNLFSNINERVTVKEHSNPPFPFSHGTHVTSIALDNIDSFSWNGFGGDMSNVEFLNLTSKRIKSSNIEFINMSFGFGDKKSPFAPNSHAFNALAKLIRDNHRVLFFVAAGNESSDIDDKYKQYPASFEYRNIITVGAINADQILWDRPLRPEQFELTSFSNKGKKNVDIFAPGAAVRGANVGQLTIPASGTSMASPYALNKALLIAEKYPKLAPLQLKEVLLYSAYIPNIEKPLPCRSGGVLFEKRALLLAELISQNPRTRIRELAMEARRVLPIGNESLDGDYLKKLKTLWQQRLAR